MRGGLLFAAARVGHNVTITSSIRRRRRGTKVLPMVMTKGRCEMGVGMNDDEAR